MLEGYEMSLNQSRGCPVSVGNTICGEANSLDIMKEFNRLYEDKMQQVDSEAGGDCSQEKIKLQQEWIRNLTQQNEMLVKAVQELEYEATERVKQLEEKLQKSAQCLCEVMRKYREHDFTTDLLSEPLQKISNLEDDIRNVLEFIRRIRENGDWNTDGLFFHKIKNVDLLGTNTASIKEITTTSDTDEGEKLLNEKERTVIDLTEKLHYYKTFGDVESMAEELECKRKEYNSLKEAMDDMRQVLTEEVASRHDQIILLKKEIQTLEDTCAQAEKQLIFKDDIIKELRKDIKQLKQQIPVPDKSLHTFNSNSIQDQHETPCIIQQPKNQSNQPYLIIQHTSKKEFGRNTVIYINKDGTVNKNVTFEGNQGSIETGAQKNSDISSKYNSSLKDRKYLFSSCKSENDLTYVKNSLKPVKERSKLTSTTLGRCKTFVDRSKHTEARLEFEQKLSKFAYTPVMEHVQNLENKKYSF